MLKYKWIVTFLICIGYTTMLISQITSIEGVIFDSTTGKPLPNTSVTFKDKNIGSTTDKDGKYFISTSKRATIIHISLLGYVSQSIEIQLNVHQKIDISLEQKKFELLAAEVIPDQNIENPSKPLIQRIIDAKALNDPKQIPAVKYNFHERIELDFNQIPAKLPLRKFWGKFGWIWDRLDSSESRVSLPWFLSESLGSIRTQNKPYRLEKIIEQSKSTWTNEGLNTSSFSTQIFNIDFYEDQFILFDKAFISPLNHRGSLFYRYYILDTININNRPNFQIAFIPRRRGEFTFEGELLIDTVTLGLRTVKSKISEGSYTNYIRSFKFEMEYNLINEKWMLVEKEEVVDLAYSGFIKNLGFYLRNKTVYYDFKFSNNWNKKDWKSKRNLSFEDDCYLNEEKYWIDKRPTHLTAREQSIYQMEDSIKSMSRFHLLEDIFYTAVTGRIKGEKLEMGPLAEMYSFNNLEGNRFEINLYTTKNVHNKLLPSISLAYGTKDKKIKYGAKLTYLKSQLPRIEYSIFHNKDLQQIGVRNLYYQGNILNSVFNLDEEINLFMVNQTGIGINRDFGRGFNVVVEFLYKNIVPGNDEIYEIPAVISSESSVMLIYTKDPKFINRWQSRRDRLTSRTPVYTFLVTYGMAGVLGSKNNYGKYKFDIAGQLRMGPFGRIDYNFDIGTHTGKLPYTLLEIPPSNQNLVTREYGITFELLNNIEYVSDTWSKSYLEWHGEGVLFRYLPYIKRLHIREVAGIKGVYGIWDSRHETVLELPEETTGLNEFYGEALVGLENIFNFLRIELNYRLTNQHENQIDNWALRFGFAFEI